MRSRQALIDAVVKALRAPGVDLKELVIQLRVDRVTISRWAKGERMPVWYAVPPLERVLGLSPGTLDQFTPDPYAKRPKASPTSPSGRCSMAEAAALLNVARPRMYRFVAEGRLERGEDGMLDRAAVLSMPRSTRGRRLKVG